MVYYVQGTIFHLTVLHSSGSTLRYHYGTCAEDKERVEIYRIVHKLRVQDTSAPTLAQLILFVS